MSIRHMKKLEQRNIRFLLLLFLCTEQFTDTNLFIFLQGSSLLLNMQNVHLLFIITFVWFSVPHTEKKFNLPQAHMTQFYSAVIESVLCSSITVWFGSASKSDIRRLQRTVRTAERIIGVHLPSLQDLFYSRVKKRAGNIITDPSHPGHDLFALLPSGRRYRSLCTRTSRHKNSFFPHAISSLNN